MGQLQRLFSEGEIARLLKEEDDSLSHETGVSGDSLDSQVDRYLGDYEAAAKEAQPTEGPNVDQMESLDWRDLVKGRLVEVGENDKDDETDPGDAAPGADALTGEDGDKLGLDSLNIEAFANDVVRLIENYDNLLEVRSTLLRRAKKFLKKSYSDEVVQAFENTIRDDHGLEAGNSKLDVSSDRSVAPAADRANGSAAPGGGGGPV